MNETLRTALASVAVSLLVLLAPIARCAESASLGSGAATVPSLIAEMAGTWEVREWMWTAPGAPAIVLPAALARRTLVGGKFLEETMTSKAGSRAAFSRISFFDFNAMTGRYEYFSIDTRAPQMMNERSVEPAEPDGMLELYGAVFVAPQWGAATNVPFRYRLIIGPIHGNTQIVELYLTPIPAAQSRGFLAFKYLYTRRTTSSVR